ncbi:MAG: PD-(D/E)XK nuclease family protein, partial [Verrucomicrobiota bacterium]|nr:PD-(D/E)XK nuclease family protein [Verrucomicrobiota bacterium]
YEPAAEEEVSSRNSRPLALSLGENDATLYGSWWHALFEYFPWHGGSDAREQAFRTFHSSSPNPNRSAKEWKLLQKPLRDSALAKFLAQPGVITQTEFPFLWRIDERNCLEGVIDLFVFDPTTRGVLLIDWKTNHATSKDAEKLRARYRPQLASYWKAVREITSCEVEAGLYSTAIGELLTYSTEEMETEWNRLAQLPPEELRTGLEDAE